MKEMITQMQMSAVSQESLQLLSEIETAHQQLSSLSSNEILERSAILYEYRKKSSSTLQKNHPISQEEDRWAQANLFVSEKISKNIIPSWQDILALHQILEPQEKNPIRTSPVFIGQHEAISPEELPALIEVFKKEMLTFNPHLHPLISACRARYWLVTLHPFLDGNGRTSKS